MRGALISVLVVAGAMAGLIGLFAWSPWDADVRERELAWMQGLAAWSDVETGAGRGCERRFDERVGSAPTQRLEPVRSAARSTCRGADPGLVVAALVGVHRKSAHTTLETDFSRTAGSIAGGRAHAYCWSHGDWEAFAEHYELVVRDEFWLAGFASPSQDRIDLAADVCEPLRRFFQEGYRPYLNSGETYDLAEAIVTLAHEAEHLRTPGASEAVVECHALQRVRGLVRGAGAGRRYQVEMAGLAWDVGYPQQFADYRTRRCRDGGPLDLHARSRAWP